MIGEEFCKHRFEAAGGGTKLVNGFRLRLGGEFCNLTIQFFEKLHDAIAIQRHKF
jgi:hypothetical protein